MKLLGKGYNGSVFLKDGKALKINHILKEEIEPNTKYNLWREIDFAENVGNKYPKYFTKLYDYKIVDDCKMRTGKVPVSAPEKIKKYNEKLQKSPYCSELTYELIDGDLDSIIDKLSRKQVFDMLLQIYEAVMILKKYKFQHRDIHAKNVGYIKKKNGKYRYKLIDYGAIWHPTYPKNFDDKMIGKSKYGDIWAMFGLILSTNRIWDYIDKHNIKINPYKKDLSLYQKKYKEIDEYFKKFSKDKDIRFNLFQILYPQEFQDFVLKNKSPNKLLTTDINVNDSYIIYIASNLKKPLNIKNYLSKSTG